MDRYNEIKQTEYDFFHNEMMIHKDKSLFKLKFISEDYIIRTKFALMLIDAEAENCIYAEELLNFFKIDDLGKYAILEDMEKFIQKFKEDKEDEMNFCLNM